MSTFTVEKDGFLLDGKEIKLVSGAMHYFRIVPEYWESRMRKLRELGCNCLETYVCWNLHEPREGTFDFSGRLDLGKYISMAESLGLYVIVRPGPYICSEWDLGGLPWWLLRYDMALRSSDPLYLEKCAPYLERVCAVLRPHLIGNGGGVVLVQVENEYGSFGNDKAYLHWLRDFYRSHGIGCGLITSDGETDFLLGNGTAEGVTASVNYRNESERCIAMLKKFRAGQPGAVMELWNGRAQHWGEPFVRRDVAEVADSVEKALDNAALVNLYMFHGGTNFGFMNGSLYQNGKFTVQATSYDVDAPLNEYGQKTPKYYAEQKVICGKRGKPIVNETEEPVLRIPGALRYEGETPLAACGEELFSVRETTVPKSMEQCGQGYGYIVYETEAYVGEAGAELLLPAVHDAAHVYADGEYLATVFRDEEQKQKIFLKGPRRVKIGILVENLGRINFGKELYDRKGLLGDLVLHDCGYQANSKCFGFRTYCFDLETLPSVYNGHARENCPAFYRYTFDCAAPCDALLRLEGFTRGAVLLNGSNLGRHWKTEGSENKLYIPAPLMRRGANELVVFDVLHTPGKKRLWFGGAE